MSEPKRDLTSRPSGRAPTVGIFGAGAIGTFVGTLLSSVGLPVILLGRRRLVDQRRQIVAIDHRGRQAELGPSAVVTDDPAVLSNVDVCLVCVKSSDTETTGQTLRRVLRDPETLVVSLQNGLRNRATLGRILEQPVSGGVVGFNVRPDGAGAYPQTTSGPLWLEDAGPRAHAIARALAKAGQSVRLHDAIGEVMRGKLLLNTINGIGGATGLRIRELMADANARWCYSQCIREGLQVFSAMGQPVARVGGLGARGLSLLLRLPSVIFQPLLAISSVDDDADTSTTRDLRRGRTTEIDQLNGELVTLGGSHGVPTPVNRIVVQAVSEHEHAIRTGRPPHFWPTDVLRAHGERLANAESLDEALRITGAGSWRGSREADASNP